MIDKDGNRKAKIGSKRWLRDFAAKNVSMFQISQKRDPIVIAKSWRKTFRRSRRSLVNEELRDYTDSEDESEEIAIAFGKRTFNDVNDINGDDIDNSADNNENDDVNVDSNNNNNNEGLFSKNKKSSKKNEFEPILIGPELNVFEKQLARFFIFINLFI